MQRPITDLRRIGSPIGFEPVRKMAQVDCSGEVRDMHQSHQQLRDTATAAAWLNLRLPTVQLAGMDSPEPDGVPMQSARQIHHII